MFPTFVALSCFATIPTRPEAPGTIGPSMTSPEIVQCFLKVLRRAMTVLSKQPTTSAASVMVEPCPPRGHGAHHCHFRLLGLSVGQISAGKNPWCNEVEREARD